MQRRLPRNEPTEKWVEDLNEVVRRAVGAASHYASERGAKLDLHCSPTPLFAEMSPIQLEQVVVNLVENAVESRTSGVFVHVETSLEHGKAILRVRDDGRGISRETLPRIFDPFFTERLQQGGSGLGLAVAHGVAVDHGGSVRVEATSPTGSCFALEIPLYEAG